MNETTRERDDLPSRGTAAGSNVELETTTTTIEQNRPAGSTAPIGSASSNGGSSKTAGERVKAEGEQVRQRAGQAGEQVRRSAAEAGEEVRRRTRETADLVRAQAAEQAAAVKHRAVEQIDTQKNGFATKICDVSGALKRAADDLEQHEDHQLAVQTRRLAEGIEGVGSHLRDSNVTDLLEDAEHFVRRNPTVALGGMFLAGLTLARFLKARPPRYQRAGFQSPTSGPSGTNQPTGGANPYMQRQGGYRPQGSQHSDLTAASDLKMGSTDPTAPHRTVEHSVSGNRPVSGGPPVAGTKPGDNPPQKDASQGNAPQSGASGNRNSGGSAPRPR